MMRLKQIEKEIKKYEDKLKDTRDLNEQWKLGHLLKDLYYEKYCILNKKKEYMKGGCKVD